MYVSEGVATVLEPLAKNLNGLTFCLQYEFEQVHETISEIATSLMPVSILKFWFRDNFFLNQHFLY